MKTALTFINDNVLPSSGSHDLQLWFILVSNNKLHLDHFKVPQYNEKFINIYNNLYFIKNTKNVIHVQSIKRKILKTPVYVAYGGRIRTL